MTVEEWTIVERKLSVPFGSVKLKIDGYTVEIIRSASTVECSLNVHVYIDKTQIFDWYLCCPEAQKRFGRYRKEYILLTARSKEGKILKGKREKILERIKRIHTLEIYYPDWTSFRSMKSHFIKNNKSIELLNK